MRILVRAPNWIGDQILAFPFFQRLRELHPSAHIASLCVPWVEGIQFRGLIDETLPIPKPVTRSMGSRLRAIRKAGLLAKSRGPWDLSYALPNSFSAAYLLSRARARKRVGFRADARSFLLSNSIPWKEGEGIHRAKAYLRLLGKEEPASLDGFWSKHRFDPAREWPGIPRIPPPQHPYYVLAPGATADSRRWPREKFLSLAERIHRETGWKGVIVGGEKEKDLAKSLIGREEAGLLDFTARGSIPALVDLLARSKFTVCNESGLAHVASILGSPTAIVCGAADPGRTKPTGPAKIIVETNPVHCWPCERNTCLYSDERKNACLEGIAPHRVWDSIQNELLR